MFWNAFQWWVCRKEPGKTTLRKVSAYGEPESCVWEAKCRGFWSEARLLKTTRSCRIQSCPSLQLHLPVTLLPVLQPHRPVFCPLNTPTSFVHQDLCSCCSLVLWSPFPNIWCGLLPFIFQISAQRSHLRYVFLSNYLKFSYPPP